MLRIWDNESEKVVSGFINEKWSRQIVKKIDKLSTVFAIFELYMRIIAKSTLKYYWETHAKSRKELENWYSIASRAEWYSPKDIKAVFPKASILGNNRVVFDIAGGNFRLVVKFAYKSQIGYIRFIGTHQEYDKIDAEVI